MQDSKRKDQFHKLTFDDKSNGSSENSQFQEEFSSSRQGHFSPKFQGQLSPRFQGQFLSNLELIVSKFAFTRILNCLKLLNY